MPAIISQRIVCTVFASLFIVCCVLLFPEKLIGQTDSQLADNYHFTDTYKAPVDNYHFTDTYKAPVDNYRFEDTYKAPTSFSIYTFDRGKRTEMATQNINPPTIGNLTSFSQYVSIKNIPEISQINRIKYTNLLSANWQQAGGDFAHIYEGLVNMGLGSLEATPGALIVSTGVGELYASGGVSAPLSFPEIAEGTAIATPGATRFLLGLSDIGVGVQDFYHSATSPQTPIPDTWLNTTSELLQTSSEVLSP